MPSIEDNRNLWNSGYAWSQGGDEWSAPWGGTSFEWYGTILPRIHRFIPAGTVLEIAPGFGRFTQYLKDLCKKLILVDLSEKCIEACRKRFDSSRNIAFHVNDGMSLAMLEDHSIDFVFSFDSLVHAEADVLESYLRQLARKLKRNGVGFLHHSNLGEYVERERWIQSVPKLKGVLAKIGVIDYLQSGRAASMSAAKFEKYCQDAGLACIGQEYVNWAGADDHVRLNTRRFIDCFSMFTPKDSPWMRPNRIVKNNAFIEEVGRIQSLTHLYQWRVFQGETVSE